MRTALMVTALLAAAGGAAAQEQPHPAIAVPGGLEWQPAPASLPPGAEVAVLDGDPAQPGPFTMRLRMPAGYRIAPHMHPSAENVTVISGAFHVGMGPEFDRSTGRTLPAGAFVPLPRNTPHFAWTETETVIQLNNMGPWTLTYVDPADDPRNAR